MVYLHGTKTNPALKKKSLYHATVGQTIGKQCVRIASLEKINCFHSFMTVFFIMILRMVHLFKQLFFAQKIGFQLVCHDGVLPISSVFVLFQRNYNQFDQSKEEVVPKGSEFDTFVIDPLARR